MILWTEGLLSKSGHGMATPALMEVDNQDNVVDIINCVVLYYEKGASGYAFLLKEIFRAPVSRQVKPLKVKVSQPEFKKSRELKRGLSFNDLNIPVLDLLYANLEYQWPLCLRYGRVG